MANTHTHTLYFVRFVAAQMPDYFVIIFRKERKRIRERVE